MHSTTNHIYPWVHVPDFRSKTYLLPQKHTARYGRKELRRVCDPRRLRRRRQAVCIAGYSSRKEDSYDREQRRRQVDAAR